MSDLTSKNKTLMRLVYEEIWNQHRVSLAAEIFERPQGVERFVSQFLSAFPDIWHTVSDMIAEDDQVAVRFTANGTHTGQWMHVAPTGLPIQYSGVTVARIAGDKITEHYTWWDKAGLMEQIQGGED